MLKIRSATPGDTPLLLSLIRELAEFEKLSHEVVATEEALHDSLFGDRKAAGAIIGEHEGQAVAFAIFFQNFSTFLSKPGIYLEDLYVNPAYRSRGFGLSMLQHLARIAEERGCGRFEWAVLNWNEHAIRFYEKLGAKPMKEWTVYRLSGKDLKGLAEN